MNIYAGLLFLQGHVASAELARQLAATDTGHPVVTRPACQEPPKCPKDTPCVS